MPKELVPIKIICRPPVDGQTKHPPGHDGIMIDLEGIGMTYGRKTTLQGDGMQYAITAIPRNRVDEYKAAAAAGGRPDDVVELTKTEAEQFFIDEEIVEPSETVNDPKRVQAIMAKKAAGVAPSVSDLEAMDPNKPEPGVVQNRKKGFMGRIRCANCTVERRLNV
jgi:hypothetical protein